MRYQTAGPGSRPVPLSDKPQGWLKEWLAGQGKYVRLSCGHPEDLHYRGVLIVGKLVLCPLCEQWSAIAKSIRLSEYVGIELPPQPDTPPY